MEQMKASGQALSPPFTWSDGLRGHLHDLLKAFEAWSLKEHGFVPQLNDVFLSSLLSIHTIPRSECDDSLGKPGFGGGSQGGGYS